MNSWGYLILIVALLGLAAVMLYARFASRSREKSLHHAPVDWVFPDGVISRAELVGVDLTAGRGAVEPAMAPDSEHGVPPVPGGLRDGGEPGTVSGPVEPVLRLGAAEGEAPGGDRRERDYIDELQEAAAGLALLMRSSPVSRPQPVVFAPEEVPAQPSTPVPGADIPLFEEEVEEEFYGGESPAGSFGEDPVGGAVAEAMPSEDRVGATESSESSEDEEGNVLVSLEEEPGLAGPALEGEKVSQVVFSQADFVGETVTPPSLEEILGEVVMEQLGRIDEGLDALESLVLGIESSLRVLGDLDQGDGNTVPVGVSEGPGSVAA